MLDIFNTVLRSRALVTSAHLTIVLLAVTCFTSLAGTAVSPDSRIPATVLDTAIAIQQEMPKELLVGFRNQYVSWRTRYKKSVDPEYLARELVFDLHHQFLKSNIEGMESNSGFANALSWFEIQRQRFDANWGGGSKNWGPAGSVMSELQLLGARDSGQAQIDIFVVALLIEVQESRMVQPFLIWSGRYFASRIPPTSNRVMQCAAPLVVGRRAFVYDDSRRCKRGCKDKLININGPSFGWTGWCEKTNRLYFYTYERGWFEAADASTSLRKFSCDYGKETFAREMSIGIDNPGLEIVPTCTH